MSRIEHSSDGTPWLLLAIYINLTGPLIAASNNSPLNELTAMVSLLPALIGIYLLVRPYLKPVE